MIKLPTLYDKLSPSEKRMVRQEYIRRQNNKCYLCNDDIYKPPNVDDIKITPKLYPKNFFDYPIHLHHSHETGLTIGVVHAKCNAILWEYGGE